jgi:hypothetical protein
MLGDQESTRHLFDTDGKYTAAYYTQLVSPLGAPLASGVGCPDDTGVFRSQSASWTTPKKLIELALRVNETVNGASLQNIATLTDVQKLALFKWQWGEGSLSISHLLPHPSATIRTMQDRLLFGFGILTTYTSSLFGQSLSLCIEHLRSSLSALLFSPCGTRLTDAFLILLLDRTLNMARTMTNRPASQTFFRWYFDSVCSITIMQPDVHQFLMSQPAATTPTVLAKRTQPAATVDATASSVLSPPAKRTLPLPTSASATPRGAPSPRAKGASGGGGARSGGGGRGQGAVRPKAPLTLPEIPPGAFPVCFKWIRQLGSCANTDVCAGHTKRSHNFDNWPPAVAQLYTAAILAMPPP